eukprot:10436593-Alexandrium_andersonii.AAC.1
MDTLFLRECILARVMAAASAAGAGPPDRFRYLVAWVRVIRDPGAGLYRNPHPRHRPRPPPRGATARRLHCTW